MMINGHQNVTLSVECRSPEMVSLYVGATIGLVPEYRRPDRDNYLTVNYDNLLSTPDQLRPLTENEFNSLGVEFDYTSAMLRTGKVSVDIVIRIKWSKAKGKAKTKIVGWKRIALTCTWHVSGAKTETTRYRDILRDFVNG
ncbi:hypothetical protein SK128_007118 [Halocaridina rubra]|uniref:Peptidase M12A domain-containing protein n=1 Tax=Halocaridina rubra TaxID=373956 RepID=A0AAN9A7P4_HALRR